MVLPLLTYSGYNYTTYSGLRELFLFGRSSCEKIPGVDSFCDNDIWITEEGWHEKLRHYVEAQRSSESVELEKELMWLYIPDFSKNGMMNSIKSIHGRYTDEIIWEEHPDCSGITVSDKPCPLRYEEMELVAF